MVTVPNVSCLLRLICQGRSNAKWVGAGGLGLGWQAERRGVGGESGAGGGRTDEDWMEKGMWERTRGGGGQRRANDVMCKRRHPSYATGSGRNLG